jgi:hypothetical protein
VSKVTEPPDDLEAVRIIVNALEQFPRNDQQRVLRWVQEKLGISGVQPTAPATQLPLTPAGAATPASASTDIRSFIARKNPTSDNQLTAAIAYYYMFEAPETARKPTIKSEDLKEAARAMGQGGRFKKPAQTLVNAHQQGLLDRSAAGGYVLSNVGENLVAVALGAEGGAPITRKKVAGGRRAKKKGPAKGARR